jgi:GrpB-like predicted nucleotidyltransferase (UPF0157 family)
MVLTEPINITAHDPAWSGIYEAEAARLRGLGASALTSIEHFGSTAIPGLRAKPTIDIMGAVVDLSVAEMFADSLRGDGYIEMSENFRFRRFFRKEAVGIAPSFHLHLVNEPAWPTKSERLFRDWLLTHPTVAREYEELKDLLAERHPRDRDSNTAAKSAFVRAVVNEARKTRGLPPLTNWEE